MSSPLTVSVVIESLDRLATNFARAKGAPPLERLAETWRDELRGISAEALRDAVRTVIQNDRYFPNIARVREAAKAYTQTHPDRSEADPLYCRGCHQKSRWEARWRPKRDERNRPIYDANGRLALEIFERYQCDCSTPSRWKADGPDDPFMTMKPA